MRSFEELVAEAEAADVSGWDFSWLDGRATEERPPWRYARLLAVRLGAAGSALDLDTGGGEVVAEASVLPSRMCATESWPANLERTRLLLGPRGVDVRATSEGDPFPFPDAMFDLVTSRHPVRPQWAEIRRVLKPGGTYFAQHVGPASAYELIEVFTGPRPRSGLGRDPKTEASQAAAAGLTVTDLREARCRMELCDIGAAVFLLRKCVWWVPDFTVRRYHDELVALDAQIRADGRFVAYSTRHLIEAVRR